MPRNQSGTFTLLNAAFAPGTVISSSAMNGDLNDIATGLTQSLSTTGVSTMTGQVKAIGGSAASPAYTFGGSLTDGIYLSGTHQLGFTTNGIQALTINSDQSVTFNGNATVTGASTLTGNVTFNATTYTFGAGAANALVQGLSWQADVSLIIDGGGNVLTSGPKGQIHIPFGLTITAWRVMADQAGSITIDVRRAHDAIPTTSIIGGGNAPSLSGVGFNEQVPSGWTATTLVKDDWIDFNVTGSPSSVTRVTVCLTCTRTTP